MRKSPAKTMSHEKALFLFYYNEISGTLVWSDRASGPKRTPGRSVGSIRIDSCGVKYLQTAIEGKYYLIHRLVWFFVYAEWPDQVDHINGDGCDNRIENLRNVDNSGNQRNRGLFKKSKTGCQGVRMSSDKKKYVASIHENSERITLGNFDTIFEAACARRSAELEYGYLCQRSIS